MTYRLNGKAYQKVEDDYDWDEEDWEEDEDEEEEDSDEWSEYSDDEELREVFDSLDTQGKGFLFQRQVFQAMRSLGFFMSKKEAGEHIQEWNEDGSGKYDFDTFQEIIYDLYDDDDEEEEEEDEEEESEEDEKEEQKPQKPKPNKVSDGGKPKPNRPGIKPSDAHPATQIKKAVFVGINYPGTDAPLKGCCNDVRTMQALLKHCNVKTGEQRVLVDDKKFKGKTGAPTKKEIVQALHWLVAGVKPGDNLFLHYSGHGTQVEAENDTTEEDGCDEALCPSDYDRAGLIIDDDINKWVVKKLPAGAHITAVFDCCHSGTIMDLPHVFRATRENLVNARSIGGGHITSKAPGGAGGQGSVFMFSGCKDDQTSADLQGDGGACGACTNAISEILSEKPSIGVVDLLAEMRDTMEETGMEQIPQLSTAQPIPGNCAFTFVGTSQL